MTMATSAMWLASERAGTPSVSLSRPQGLSLGLRFRNGGLSLGRNLGLAIRTLSCTYLAQHPSAGIEEAEVSCELT